MGAIEEFLYGNNEFARKILQKAFLYESFVDYLEFQRTDKLSKIILSGKNEENNIIQYLRYRLGLNKTSTISTLIKQYDEKFKNNQVNSRICFFENFKKIHSNFNKQTNASVDEYIQNYSFIEYILMN